MASYTMELRTIVEQPTSFIRGLDTRQKIEEGRKQLFDFDYPIFDPEYKKVFETNFIRKFYMREIGFETEELFKFQLETWLNINMPYYNQLFESQMIKFDPFENSRVDVSHNKNNSRNQNDNRNIDYDGSQSGKTDGTVDSQRNGNSNSTQTGSRTTEGESFQRELESNNPDSRLAITSSEGNGVIEYASKIDEDKINTSQSDTTRGTDNTTSSDSTKDKSNVNTTASQKDKTKDTFNSQINDIEDFVQSRAGKIGVQSYSKMLKEFRETFLRIEEQIHKEISSQLFMLIY